MIKIGITIGDPAGVGPELIVKISQHFKDNNAYIIYGEEKILKEVFLLLGYSFSYSKIDDVSKISEAGIYLVDLNISETERPLPSISSGKVAVGYLARAVVDGVYGNIDALLTMPISKFWAKRAGFGYDGHTEYLAHVFRARDYAMMMYSDEVKVVLLTDHIPFSSVTSFINEENIRRKINMIFDEFGRWFGFKPRVGVLGLNPHAGEGGEIGREDMEIIYPVVEEFKRNGFGVEGPLPPDTAFLKREEYDVYLCMYHDQGLIPFKLLSFYEGVNMTLGIPLLRVSPDHGTAYDIAWKGVADYRSSLKALELIEELAVKGKKIS